MKSNDLSWVGDGREGDPFVPLKQESGIDADLLAKVTRCGDAVRLEEVLDFVV